MRIDLHKHSHLIIILLSVIVGMVAMGAVIYYPHLLPAHAEPGAVAPVPADWQTAFSTVAQEVLPAVVSIQGKASVEEGPSSDLPPWFKNFPFPFGGPEGPQGNGNGGGNPPRHTERPFLGSGWLYSPDGYIVTNAHVVEHAMEGSLKVQLHDEEGAEPVPAKVIGYDARSDLAVIKVDVNRKLPYLSLASSKDAKVGEWVLAFGSPFSTELQQTVTQGIISAKGRVLEGAASELGALGASIGDVIQTDAAINPGNSGGPLVDLAGRVVGINESIISPGGAGGFVGIGFAISSDTAQRVVPQLMQNKQVVRGWLGVVIGDLDENLRDFYKAPNGGALIDSINPDGPAAKSGLQAEDVVIQANDTPVRRSSDLQAAVTATQPGTVLHLTLLRNGQQMQIDVKVGEMPGKYAGTAPPTPGEEGAPQQADPLGLQVQTLQPDTAPAQALGLKKGVLVMAVDPEGPAAEDLRPGDAITQVDRTQVDSADAYRQALDTAKKAGAKYVVLRVTHKVQGEVMSSVVDITPNW
jgi:serine protease Do